jgi:hypothetical protein
MLELVISDDLTPSLTCPLCGWLYVRCSLRIPEGGPKCSACGGSIQLLDLLPKQQRTSPAPPGVAVVDEGANWSIGVSARSLKAGLASAVAAVALLAAAIYIWTHGGWLFGGGNDSDSAALRKLGAISFAGAIGLFGNAAWRLWGRYTVSVRGDIGTVLEGVAGLGSKRTFNLAAINGVCLAKAVYIDRNGNQIEKKAIRLEGVGFYMNIAEEMADANRAYLALFLLQKRVDSSRNLGAAAG